MFEAEFHDNQNHKKLQVTVNNTTILILQYAST